MSRLVFFGLDGAFSTIPLTALAASGLRPELVVRGVAATSRGVVCTRRPARGLLKALHARTEVMRRTAQRQDSSSLLTVAHQLDIDVLDTSDANQPRVLAALDEIAPDAFVIAGFSHLLAPTTLARARRGGINVHPGRLPEERGPAPVFWALKNGRNPLTVTLHVLDAGEDTGDVICALPVPFEAGADGFALHARCAEVAAPQLPRAVRALLAGDLVCFPQRRDGVGRCPRPTFRDGLIDPNRPAVEVYSFVAACARHHSIWAECAGDRFFIAEAISFDDAARMRFDFVLTGDRLILRCSPGLVELRLKEDGALFSARSPDVD